MEILFTDIESLNLYLSKLLLQHSLFFMAIFFVIYLTITSLLEKDSDEEKSFPFSVVFLVIFSLLFLSSCKSEKKTPEEPQIVEVKGVGSTDFGKVPLTETRVAGLLLVNKKKTVVEIPIVSLNNPFSVNYGSTTCGSTLNPGQSCILAISFTPSSRGIFNTVVSVFEKDILFSGQGTDAGVLIVSPAIWNIPVKVAGQPETINLTISNSGDRRFNRPVITNVNDYTISSTNCASEILPGVSCTLGITFQRRETGTYFETMRLFSSASVYFDVQTTVTVNPSTPDGIILFSGVPSNIVSDGNDIRTINITKVPDIFGNPVLNGTQVNLSATNCTLIDGNSVTTTNGQATFRIQSTTSRGNCFVSAFTGSAYGQFTIKAASDKASGTITVASFNNVLRATGNSSVTIRTNPILDQNLNVINDGELVYFELTGPGTIDKTTMPSYNGEAFVKITSPTGAGNAILKIRSNPIYSGETIVGWGAESADITINYVAGFPTGTFPITCDRTSIYKEESSDPYLSTIDSTMCHVGPLKDEFNNNIGAGGNANIRIVNGVNKATANNVFSITTDASSIASFELSGVGTKGDIEIEAEVSGFSVTHKVFATTDNINYYLPFFDRMRVYYGYGPAITSTSNTSVFPVEFPGSKIVKYRGNLSALSSLDYENFGLVTYSDDPKELNYNFPYFTDSDCIKNVDKITQIMPCFYMLKSGLNIFWGSSDLYSFGDDLGLGVLKNPNLNYDLGSNSTHGSYQNILSTGFYSGQLDSFIKSKGVIYSGSSPNYYTEESTKASKISYPSAVVSAYDLITVTSVDLSLTGLMTSYYETSKGEVIVFGGSDYSLNFSNELKKIKKDVNEDLQIGVDTIAVADHPVSGPIPAMVLSSLYLDEDANTLYVIGGYAKSGTDYVFNDQVWRARIDIPSVWEIVCSSCGLPGNNSIWMNNNLKFPLVNNITTPNVFETIVSGFSRPKVQLDGNRRVVYNVGLSNSYELNLANGSTSLLSGEYDSFNGSYDFKINPISGRKFGLKRGSNTTGDSKIWFHETNKGTKKYYISEFDLDTNSSLVAQRVNIKISAFGHVVDGDGNSLVGLSAYIFNYSLNQWEFLTNVNNTDEVDAYNNPVLVTKNESNNVRRYISAQGKMNIMLTVSGSPGCHNGPSCVDPGESLIRINYLEIQGQW